ATCAPSGVRPPTRDGGEGPLPPGVLRVREPRTWRNERDDQSPRPSSTHRAGIGGGGRPAGPRRLRHLLQELGHRQRPCGEPTRAAPAETSTSTGSSSGGAAAGGSSKLSLEANSGGQLAYNTKSLSASAGNVTIDFTNNSPIEHDVTVESAGGQKVGATPVF